MDKVRRILVYVCKDGAAPQRVQFIQSVVGQLSGGGSSDQVEVSCWLEENRFLLSSGRPEDRIPLKRPPCCPVSRMSPPQAAALPLAARRGGVDVGVALLLQTANQRLLLTRRAPQLRIFPNVWVPPGGHVEPDESLLDAGLRELEEETGLRLDPEGLDPQILGLWESVFPPLLSRGPPQRHHIVVYMLLKTPQTHLQLQASLSPAPSEVRACLWADGVLAKAAVDGEILDQQPISVTEVSLDGSLTQTSVSAAVFSSVPPPGGPDLERVSTGTKFALELWLRTLKGPDRAPPPREGSTPPPPTEGSTRAPPHRGQLQGPGPQGGQGGP